MLDLYECGKRLSGLSDLVKQQLKSFAPNEQEHYGQEAMQALERLAAIIQVRKYLESSDKHFSLKVKGRYPIPLMRSYDISSEYAMRELHVHTVASFYQTQKIVKNLSLNEALTRLRKRVKRHDMFKDLQKLIIQDITWVERIDRNCNLLCQKIRSILVLLGELVSVVNQAPGWEHICEHRGWESKKLNTHNELSTVESMLNQKITTNGVTHLSLQDLLSEINNIETAKYFFNRIYDCVMPEVYHLQERAHGEKERIIAEGMTTRVTCIVDALIRLYEAVNKKYSNIYNSEYYKFASIGELLDAKIDHTMSLRDAILFSPDGLADANILLQSLETLHKHSTNFVRPLGQIYTMHDGMRTSPVVAKTLCSLVECGDLEQIRAMNPCSYNIDLLIDHPMQLQFSTLYKDALHTYAYPLSAYAGRYNALILAVLYRHTEIVRYFLQKGANPRIKGGRRGDLTVEGCLSVVMPGVNPATSELCDLFPVPGTIRSNFVTRHNFYRSEEISQGRTEQPKQSSNSVCTVC